VWRPAQNIKKNEQNKRVLDNKRENKVCEEYKQMTSTHAKHIFFCKQQHIYLMLGVLNCTISRTLQAGWLLNKGVARATMPPTE